jgi:hypothetical protein
LPATGGKESHVHWSALPIHVTLEITSRRRSGGDCSRNSPTRSRDERLPIRYGAYRGLLKLGIEVGQTMVAKHMAKRPRPPSKGWKTFIDNHSAGSVSIDLFVFRRSRFGCCMDF